VIPDGERERQSVLHHHRVTADVSFATDTTELMHAGISADIRAIIYRDMTGKRGGVGHNDMIAKHTIVRDMSLGHQEAIITDLRQSPATRGATMDSHELPDARAAADYGLCFLTGELQILRRQPNRNKRMYIRLITDVRAAINHTMRLNDDAFAQDHIVANYGVRSNLTAFADLRARTDDC
jgi:hypothetical protein